MWCDLHPSSHTPHQICLNTPVNPPLSPFQHHQTSAYNVVCVGGISTLEKFPLRELTTFFIVLLKTCTTASQPTQSIDHHVGIIHALAPVSP